MNTENKSIETASETLLEFPCEFPIKVMGINHALFTQNMCELIANFVSHEVPHTSAVERPSSNGKYSAVTINITIESKAQLDQIYQALYEHTDVKMTL